MNLSYEFWVKYYSELANNTGLSEATIEAANRRITGFRWTDGEEMPELPNSQKLFFKSKYPGVLVGLGYAHSAGAYKIKDAPEIGLGINLDTVTGLPFIPGSSVKGSLRYPFIKCPEYIAELMGEQLLGRRNDNEKIKFVHLLENEIFGDLNAYDERKIKGEDLPDKVFGSVVFYDAWPVKADNQNHLLGPENITPHKANDSNLDGLVEPTPLNLLKVMPGVTFMFRFGIKNDITICLDNKKSADVAAEDEDGEKAQENHENENQGSNITVKVKDLMSLFKQIILDLGIGAKTNVGFGLLESCDDLEQPQHFLRINTAEPQNQAGNNGANGQANNGHSRNNGNQGNQNTQNQRQNGNRQNHANASAQSLKSGNNGGQRRDPNSQQGTIVIRFNSFWVIDNSGNSYFIKDSSGLKENQIVSFTHEGSTVTSIKIINQ